MKTSGKLILAVLASGLICGQFCAPQALAVPISGNIAFAGTITMDTSSAGTAHAVTGWYFVGTMGTPYVAGADGDFAGTIGSFATFNAPWNFNSGLAALWNVGGFTFDLLTSAITDQGFHNGLGFVVVHGTGIISGNGFDPTFGTWSFSTQDPGTGSLPIFSFSAASLAQAVPDGGSTVALLGLTLAGVECLRRKLRKAKE